VTATTVLRSKEIRASAEFRKRPANLCLSNAYIICVFFGTGGTRAALVVQFNFLPARFGSPCLPFDAQDSCTIIQSILAFPALPPFVPDSYILEHLPHPVIHAAQQFLKQNIVFKIDHPIFDLSALNALQRLCGWAKLRLPDETF
jgi:hypothetical protein